MGREHGRQSEVKGRVRGRLGRRRQLGAAAESSGWQRGQHRRWQQQNGQQYSESRAAASRAGCLIATVPCWLPRDSQGPSLRVGNSRRRQQKQQASSWRHQTEAAAWVGALLTHRVHHLIQAQPHRQAPARGSGGGGGVRQCGHGLKLQGRAVQHYALQQQSTNEIAAGWLVCFVRQASPAACCQRCCEPLTKRLRVCSPAWLTCLSISFVDCCCRA